MLIPYTTKGRDKLPVELTAQQAEVLGVMQWPNCGAGVLIAWVMTGHVWMLHREEYPESGIVEYVLTPKLEIQNEVYIFCLFMAHCEQEQRVVGSVRVNMGHVSPANCGVVGEALSQVFDGITQAIAEEFNDGRPFRKEQRECKPLLGRWN